MGMGIADIGAFVANVATSVMIIFVNKLLMNTYEFNFAVTLSGLHYLAAALLMQAYNWTGLMTAKGVMPWKDRLLYTGVSSVSIISLNVSLLLNTVCFEPGCSLNQASKPHPIHSNVYAVISALASASVKHGLAQEQSLTFIPFTAASLQCSTVLHLE
jgi:hypothetical protein